MIKRFLTFALSVGFFIWLPSAFADGSGILSLDAPSHIRQTQNDDKALLTLRVDNIQVRAEWQVTSAVKVFDIDEGELRTVTTVAPGIHVATIYAVDKFDLLNDSYVNLTASAVITVEFLSGGLELADAPRLTAVAGKAVSLHTFVAEGGSGDKTYTLVAGGDGYFSVGATSGVLSLSVNAQAGVYTLTVRAAEEGLDPVEAVATVEVSAALMLADAPLLSVVLGEAVSLYMFSASGGIGIKTYTLAAGDERYFSVSAGSGVLFLLAGAQAGVHMLTVQAIDGRNVTVNALATVRVSAALMLADAPPFTVIASMAMSLHTFIASGGIGAPTYTILVGNQKEGFTLNAASGVLSLVADAEPDTYVLRIQATDARGKTDEALATVGVSAVLALAAAPPFTVIASVGMSLHTFIASGGIGTPTYTILAGNEGGDFTLNAASGVLSLLVNAEVGSHALTVRVMDARNNAVDVVATVGVSAALELTTVSSFTVIASMAMSLHTFIASGGIGIKTYALVAGDDEEYFSVDAASGVFSLSLSTPVREYTLTVQAMDARDNTVETVVTVGVSAALMLSDAPPFTVIVSAAMSLHTFIASGGIGTPTYTILTGNEKEGFILHAASGVLSLVADAEPATYVLRIQAMDARDNKVQAMVTVGVSAVLSLSDAQRLGGAEGQPSELHIFAAQGGIGARTYTLLVGDAAGYFSLGAESGVLSLLASATVAMYTLSVRVKDGKGNMAQALATVEVRDLFLANAGVLYAIEGRAVSLYTFEAQGGVGSYTLVVGDKEYFTLGKNNGVLSVLADAPIGIYTLSVQANDADGNHADAMAVVEVRASLSLVAMPPLTIIVGRVAHTLTASGGIGIYTYAIVPSDEDGGFALDAASGVLSLRADAALGRHLFTVQVADARNNTVQAVATVEVSAVLALADAPSFTVIASVAMSLHTFISSGGIGAPTYTIVADNEDGYFALNAASGVLSLQTDAALGRHTLTVQVMDERGNTDQAMATVEVSVALSLAEVSPLTIIVGDVAHTLVASGGIGVKTYTITGGDGGGHFALDVISGVLSLSASAPAKMYTLTVRATDERSNIAEVVAMVDVSAVLALAAAPSFTVIASVAMSLHTFIASGGIGVKTYTLVAGDDEGYFAVDAASGVFSLSVNAPVKEYMLTVQVMDERGNTTQAVVTVGVSVALSLAEVSPLTIIVGDVAHTLVASGGIGVKTYTITGGDEGGYFALDVISGVLSLSASAPAKMYTLTVRATDERNNTAEVVATVDVSAVLALAAAPSFTVIASVAMSLHTFIASGGIGSRTYTLLAGDEGYFSVGAGSGVLSLSMNAEAGRHTLTVHVMDARDNTAQAVVMVEVSAALELADAPPFTVIISAAMSLHTFIASGGIGTPTYTIVAGNEAGHFTLNATSGLLSLQADAVPNTYVLRIQAIDGRDNTAEVLATVGVSAVLVLAAAPSFTVIASVAMSLHTFIASGGIGTPTYTILVGNEDGNFTLNAASGVLSLSLNAPTGEYTLTVQVMDERGNTAQVLATVEVSAVLALADALLLRAIVTKGKNLHTFAATGGIGDRTYTIAAGNEDYFSLDPSSGVLSMNADATVAMYTLSVQVADAKGNVATALATVEVVYSLLRDAMLYAIVGRKVSLHTFEAGGGDDTQTYTIVAGNEDQYFTIDATSGVLSVQGGATVGIYTLSVAIDDAGGNREAEVMAVVAVEASLFLADVPLFTVFAVAMSVHTFAASGGIGAKTYTITAAGDGVDSFILNATSGVLSVANATAGVYTLSVKVSDSRGNSAQARGTVEVVEVLSLADVSLDALARLPVTVVLHTFAASGGYGAKRYTMIADESGYFVFDADSGELSLPQDPAMLAGEYTLFVVVSDSLMPPQRVTATVVVRIGKNGIFVMGGRYSTSGYPRDVWFSLDGKNWLKQSDTSAWPGRYEHQVASHQGRLYLMGGYAPSINRKGVWSSSAGKRWSFESNQDWAERSQFQVVEYKGRLYAMGGTVGSGASGRKNDVWSSVDGESWMLVTMNAAWPARQGHQVVVHNGRMYLLGGFTGGYRDDVWSSADGSSWSFEGNANWSGRLVHQAVSHQGRLYVLGGRVSSHPNRLSDVWSWAVGEENWIRETPNGWPIRDNYQAVSYDGLLYVMGGIYSGTRRNDVWSSADGKKWTEVTANAGWAARESPQAEVFPSPLVIWGVGASEAIILTVGVSAAEIYTVTAQYGLGPYTYSLTPENIGIKINGDGVLSLDDDQAQTGAYAVTVRVEDKERSHAEIIINIEIRSFALADAPPLSVFAGLSAVSLHVFTAIYGVGESTYNLVDDLGYFTLGTESGVLSLTANLSVGVYTVSVVVRDAIDNRATVVATVEAVPAPILSLADAPSLETFARLSLTVTLHTFAASGGAGSKRYTVFAGNEAGYFALDADSGELSLPSNSAMLAGDYTLRVGVSDILTPPQRVTAAATVRIIKNGVFVLGGDSNGTKNDVWWSADGEAWNPNANTGWSARSYHHAVVYQGRLYVLGGTGNNQSNGNRNDVWSSLDGKSWRQEKANNNAFWSRRQRHQSLSHDGLLYVLGGDSGSNDTAGEEVWSSADGKIWTRKMNAAWSRRLAFQAVVHNGRMYMLGGFSSSTGYENDVWSSADGVNWRFEGYAEWLKRTLHQAVSHQGRLYILGGNIGGAVRNDVWSSLDGKSWRQEKANNNAFWSKRQLHQSLSRDGLLYVMGGGNGGGTRNDDVWSSADGKSWTKVSDAAWSARRGHQAVVFPPNLVLSGISETITLMVPVAAVALHTLSAQYGGGQYTYSLMPEIEGINIDKSSGVLLADNQAQRGAYEITVRVEDEEGSHAETIINVDLRAFILADAPPLSVFAGAEAMSLHVFTAIYGVGTYTYDLVDDSGYFTLGTASGVLSVTANVAVGVYTLSVVVRDDSGHQAAAVATVEARALSLADAPPLEALARLSVTVSLHTFAADGIGSKRYTLIADQSGYFALDADSGELSLPSNSAMVVGTYTLRVGVSDSMTPPQRATAAATVQIARNGIFVLGGNESHTANNDLQNDVWWSADGESWRENTSNAGWTARESHQVVAHRGRMYLMGGFEPGARNDVWSSLDGKNWSLVTGSADWSARGNHQALVHNGRMYVLGGRGTQNRNDVWSSLDGKNWSLVTGSAGWPARQSHQAVSHNGRLYVLGGRGTQNRNDVWSSADGANWRFEGNAEWSGRWLYKAVSHNGRLYILGGNDGGRRNDVWSSLDGRSWTLEKANNNAFWTKRGRYQALSRDGLLYVLGGNDNSLRKDVWSSSDGKNWTEETSAAGWEAREYHQALVFPPNLVLSGTSETIILTLQATVVALHTVSAQYGVGQYTYSLPPEIEGINIDGAGVLSADNQVQAGVYEVTVRVEDEEGSHAETIINIDLRVLALADAPPLSVFARAEAMSVHVFTAIYGFGKSTYNLVDDSGYFTLGTESGVLSVSANVAVGVYTLSVVVSDENNNQATAVATVEADPLSLADAPPLEALARLSVTVALHTFVASAGIGSKRYTLIDDKSGYFALDADSGELSLPSNSAMLAGAYTLRVGVSDSMTPPQRATAAATVQIARNGIFVLGGNESHTANNDLQNDVWWSADGESWRENTSSAGWTARENHQVVAYRGRMYLMGGWEPGSRNDVWSSLDGKNWSLVTGSAGWSARGLHQALVHNGRMYVLGGGQDGVGPRNDVWSSADGVTWREDKANNSVGWSARWYHQALVHNGRMYVLGGYDKSDVWSSSDGSSWRFEGDAAWGSRHLYQAVSHAGRLYVLGGIQGANFHNRRNDVWSSLDGRSWVEDKANNNAFWTKRDRYQALSRDGLLYVLGGNAGSLRKDVWSSSDGKSWTEETSSAGWEAREYHQALVFPPNLVLSGSSETITLTVQAAAVALHTLSAQYGFGQYIYSLTPEIEGFKIDESSGVLSADGNAAVGDYTLTVQVEDEEGSQAETVVQVEIVAASTAALSAMERFAWSGSGGSRNDVGLSEHGDSGRREGEVATFSASDAVSRIGVGRGMMEVVKNIA